MQSCINAILLMSGNGTRFNSDVPKQFHSIAGKKIYTHTLERFLQTDLFEKIILVCHSDWMDEVRANLPSEKVCVVIGGDTRQRSSYLGLLACGPDTDIVVIHDAVRPFCSEKIIRQN